MKHSLLCCILVALLSGPSPANPQASKSEIEKPQWKIVNPVEPPRQKPIPTGGSFGWEPTIYRVDPVYPSDARELRISGVVILQVVVNEEGEVYEAQVIKGHRLLNRAALDAVRQWRYRVSFIGGKPVPVLRTVPISFDPRR
jgi:protein TonB